MKRILLALSLVACLVCAPATLAARLFNGSNQTLQAASVDLSGVNKATLAFWLWWDGFANDDDLAFEFTASASLNNGFNVNPNSSVASNFACQVNTSGASSFTRGGCTRPSAAAWHQYVIVFDTSVNPDTIAIYIDGVSQSITYSVQVNGTGNLANSTLNFMARNNTNLFGAGRLAEVAIWPGIVNLTADEITTLAKGYSPALVRPSAKPYYWPLIGRTSPEQEMFYAKTATVVGATQTAHPRIYHSKSANVTP